jgi:calcineurin-like phosphoesterase family protein
MNTFFTADHHFFHGGSRGGIIRYCNRPFSSVEEMNETMIQKWNAKVQNGDKIFHLGDFAFGNRETILTLTRRLHGNIEIILGNHDEIGQPKNYGFTNKHKMLEIKIEGQHITLCHYSLRVWPKSQYDAWQLYGHSHGSLEPQGKSWDVGVDRNNFELLSFEEIKKIMESRPHNFNWVSRLPGYNIQDFEEARVEEMS